MRMRSLLWLAPLLLTACAARPQPRPTPPPTPPAVIRPPAPAPAVPAQPVAQLSPAAVFDHFRQALERNDAPTAWSLLSSATQQEVGPTPEQFAATVMGEMRQGYGGWQTTRPLVESQVGDNLAAIAIIGDRLVNGSVVRGDLVAVPLMREAGQWRLAIGIGPTLSAAAPPAYQDTPATSPRVAVYISSDRPIATGRLWLDGAELPAHTGGPTATEQTASAEPARPLQPGVHTVVAFAADNRAHPAALAWSFRVTGPAPSKKGP